MLPLLVFYCFRIKQVPASIWTVSMLGIFCRMKVSARPCSLGLPSISLRTIFGTFWKVFCAKRVRVMATHMSGATGKVGMLRLNCQDCDWTECNQHCLGREILYNLVKGQFCKLVFNKWFSEMKSFRSLTPGSQILLHNHCWQ